MMFKDMKVATKLAASFGLLVALLCVIGMVCALRIQSINERIGRILDDCYVKVSLATTVADAANSQARFIRNTVISAKDPAQNEDAFKNLAKWMGKTDEGLARLEKALDTAPDRDAFKTILATRAAFDRDRDEVQRLVKAGQFDEAAHTLLYTMRPTQQAYFGSLAAMVKLQSDVMAAEGAAAKAEGRSAVTVTIAMSGVAVLLAIAMATAITRGLTRQLGGEPADVVHVAGEIAGGNLAIDVHARAGDTTSILAAMRRMRERLAEVVGQVRESSVSIANGSAEIATGNADLSQRTEEQASNLQQTAASMEQLTGSVRANADTAGVANRLASEASGAASRGGEAVGRVVATMDEIASSSRRIGDIIGVIDGIAFQTNILALNAAVEAARAGEQGRGFAVVAGEVRSLAQRSANAAKEIKGLIGASVEKVDLGSRQVADAGSSMNEIVAQVRRVSQLIGEISGATEEQSTGIGQIGDAVDQLDHVTQQNAALVEESAAAAESLSRQAARLAEVVSVFKV
jgi:methyl-accepting chemotaxis protein